MANQTLLKAAVWKFFRTMAICITFSKSPNYSDNSLQRFFKFSESCLFFSTFAGLSDGFEVRLSANIKYTWKLHPFSSQTEHLIMYLWSVSQGRRSLGCQGCTCTPCFSWRGEQKVAKFCSSERTVQHCAPPEIGTLRRPCLLLRVW